MTGTLIHTKPRIERILTDKGLWVPELTAITAKDLVLGGSQQAAARGFNQAADVVRQTADGLDLNTLWDEFQRTLRMWNTDRDALTNLLTFRVTGPIEDVNLPNQQDFEEASEYGVPKGIRTGIAVTQAGYGFKWYDIAMRYTWMFLAENDARQVRTLHDEALEADNRLMFTKILKQIFNTSNGTTTMEGQALSVFPFYNADGTVPPPYKTTTFTGTHTHYLSSGAAIVDPVDLQDMEDHLWHHGYRITRGYRLVLLVNRQEGLTIRTFERGVNGARYDFIANASAFGGGIIMPDGKVIGAPQMQQFPDLQTIGTYGPWIVVEEDYVPPAYMVGFATGGEDNIGNPVGIREHVRAELRGLRLLAGSVHDYPLTDSFYLHGFGTGVRHRGAGVIMQVTANANYAAPAAYA